MGAEQWPAHTTSGDGGLHEEDMQDKVQPITLYSKFNHLENLFESNSTELSESMISLSL